MVMPSCRKYEDGPLISLTSRKKRVANTWVINRAYENGREVTHRFEHYELYLTENGSAELDANYTVFGYTFEDETSGTWRFINKDEEIQFNFEHSSQDATYMILRLTKDEFWLRKLSSDLELELREK